MDNPAIYISGLEKTFGTGRKGKKVLHSLSLLVNKGEVFGFLGPNGAGKSTTIKILLNFLRPDRGSIAIHGCTVGKQEFRQHIGYLPEFPCFYEHLTASETLYLSGRLHGMPKKTLQERADLLLTRLNLNNAAHQRVSGFSKGMKQRLGMANSLIHDPSVLIFDEPMSGLDPLGRNLVKELIQDLKAEGKTVFFSSHILSDIETLCDRIGILHKGNLLYSGDIHTFKSDNKGDLEERFVAIIDEVEHAGMA